MLRRIAMTFALMLWGAAAVACPSFDAQGTPYQASHAELLDARHFAVEAGGTFDVSRCGQVEPRTDAGPGFFDAAPQFSFQMTGLDAGPLMLSVISQCDATLLVASPLSAWYYDDNDNGAPHPRLAFNTPSSGRWDVWVGTRDCAECDAILSVETFAR